MERSADEAKDDYIAKMGQDLGTVYHHLWQETGLTFQLWEEYVELFGTKPERIGLLNEAAPRFFGLLEYALWDLALLHVARLLDPVKSGGKETLTLRRLPLLVHGSIRPSVEKSVEEASVRCDFARVWRDRRIAHNDLEVVLDTAATVLPPASRQQVSEALEAIVAVLDVVSKHYLNTTNMFDWKGGRVALGAVALLHVLDDGVRARDERLARWHRGEVDLAELQRSQKDL